MTWIVAFGLAIAQPSPPRSALNPLALQLQHRVAAQWPADVAADRIVRCLMEVVVAEDGAPERVQVPSPEACAAPFRQAATEALKQWRWAPLTTLPGRTARALTEVLVRFVPPEAPRSETLSPLPEEVAEMVASASYTALPHHPPPPRLTLGGEGWLRDGEDCFSVSFKRGGPSTPLCTVERAGVELQCELILQLGARLSVDQERCWVRDIDGTQSEITSLPPEWVDELELRLVDGNNAPPTWMPSKRLAVTQANDRKVRHACSTASLRALKKEARRAGARSDAARAQWLEARGIVGEARVCEEPRDLVVQPMSEELALPLVQVFGPTMDCRQPCPESVLPARALALTEELAPWRFYADNADGVVLYPSRSACMAAAPAPFVLPRDACERLGEELLGE